MSLATLPLEGPLAPGRGRLGDARDADRPGAGARPSRRHPGGGLGVRAGGGVARPVRRPCSPRGAPTTASSASSSRGWTATRFAAWGPPPLSPRTALVDSRARPRAAATWPGASSATTPLGIRGSPPGAGPVFTGGFAFAPAGGSAPEWAGFAPAQLVLPEVGLRAARDGGAPDRHAGRRGWRGARRPARPSGGPGARAAARGHAAAGPTSGRASARGRRHAARALRGGRAARRGADPRGRARQGRAGARGAGARPGADRPRAGAGWAARGLRGLLLLLRRRARGRVRGRQPGAAGSPRGRAGPDRGAGRHDPPQRGPRGGRPPGRAAAPEPQEPRGAGHRDAADPSAGSTR